MVIFSDERSPEENKTSVIQIQVNYQIRKLYSGYYY